MLAHHHLDRLATTGKEIGRRLRARISPWELFALALALSLLGGFVWTHLSLNILPNDFYVYLRTASGDFSGYYYAYWMLPVFALLALLPPLVAYAIWGVFNILCIFFATRIFGGRTSLNLLSFQMLYVAFIGQIIGVIAAGLALLWWGLHRRRWALAGLGLTIACTKFHIGLIVGSILLLIADISWRERLRVLVVPAVVLALSLVIYPMWPLDVLATIRNTPANDWGSISLWRWIGPSALFLWIPALLLPLLPADRPADALHPAHRMGIRDSGQFGIPILCGLLGRIAGTGGSAPSGLFLNHPACHLAPCRLTALARFQAAGVDCYQQYCALKS